MRAHSRTPTLKREEARAHILTATGEDGVKVKTHEPSDSSYTPSSRKRTPFIGRFKMPALWRPTSSSSAPRWRQAAASSWWTRMGQRATKSASVMARASLRRASDIISRAVRHWTVARHIGLILAP